MIEGGKTPLLTLEELKDMGLASVGYPLMALFSAARAVENAYTHLIGEGNSIAILDKLLQFQDFAEVVGLEDKYRLDEKFSSLRSC